MCGINFQEGSEGVPSQYRPFTASPPNFTKSIFSAVPTYTTGMVETVRINDDGEVAGTIKKSNNENPPVSYDRGVLFTSPTSFEEVCPLAPYYETTLKDYTCSGLGVGMAWGAPGVGPRGYIWTTGCAMELLPSGMDEPEDVNEEGWVVGSRSLVIPDSTLQNGYALHSLVHDGTNCALDSAAVTAQWTISPHAINNSGFIVGSGFTDSNPGLIQAVLLIPTFEDADKVKVKIKIKPENWKTTNDPTTIPISYRRQIGDVVVESKNDSGHIEIASGQDYGTLEIMSEYRGRLVFWVKGPKWLAKKITVNVPLNSSADVTSSPNVILGGDADDNNIVTTDDYLVLNGSFDKSLGDPGYDDRADFDGDKQVTTDDYLMLSSNFDVSGDL